MTKMLFFCVAETYKGVLRDANHFQNSPVMTHPVMYTKLSLKKKIVGIITDPQLAIFDLLLFLAQSLPNAPQPSILVC